ncbi:ribose 5-phosphate isomerase B [Anaerophaga thermohalophila]|uniref:ribose 5-phosphate isomerase B n=1 Tax=Anaerophaga thermohalophila TaxID=177400 RepID=UPI000237C869|nr:ribose 5-phosphate isomerase B [Anaerophaga thermohalophila]MDI3520046.1 ribose 5-phosphate isomerase [Anaerophaga sp.]
MLFKKIGIGSDHAGFSLKTFIKGELLKRGLDVVDFGTDSDDSTDYPDYAHPLAEAVEKGECEIGIAICGSGNGMSMTLNKHQGIRSAVCWNTEIAYLARLHNDANICALPGRFIKQQEAIKIVNAFLTTGFEGGRHKRRIDKIPYKKQ